MTKRLDNLKVAIIVADGFEQVEMTKPREALEKAGAKTILISPKKTVKGCHHDKPGDEFPVDVLLDDANPQDYAALLLPGGVFNPDQLRLLPSAINFIRQIFTAGKPVAAICHGPWTLINAEVVKGKTLTSWPSIKIDLINAGANWVDKEVVRDGNLVTSRKPDDIPAFNQAIIELYGEAT
jgi:protease I